MQYEGVSYIVRVIGKMDELQQSILALIKKTVPDVNEAKAMDLAAHLTSEAVGVRSLERLFDVPLDVINLKVPVCDAVTLHRSWQAKFRPDRLPLRELQNQAPTTYRVKWNLIPRGIIADLEKGKWLSKSDRCLMIRLIVKDALTEDPNISRTMFTKVAESMVSKYPHSLHDRNKSLTSYKYIDQKLKFRYDEEMRAFKVKSSNEAPNIPEAHGCVRWRVKITPEKRIEMENIKEVMSQIFSTTLVKDWPWEEIDKHLLDSFPLQREDINGQTKPRARRARGAGRAGGSAGAGQQQATDQDADQENRKTTQQLSNEWPFLFRGRGMLIHFNELTQIDWLERLEEFQENFEPNSFIKFLSTLKELESSSTRTKYKRAVKHQTCKNPELLAIVLMLVQFYKEDEEEILIEIESTTKINEVQDIEGLVLPPTPCLLSLGPAFKAKRFYFSIDSNVVSSAKTFKEGLTLLFCSYFVMNIKYAPHAGNTLDFLQRIVAKIEPERGTKMTKRNYKQPLSERLQTLLDKYANWEKALQQEQEQGEEDNADDLENDGDTYSSLE